MPKPRLIYMGTPDFAVPALRALAARPDIDLALVVTQPDRPAGRGRRLTPPPVKTTALELSLPILQTHTLRDADVRDRITVLAPDLIVVAAFGLILGRWVLDLPRHGCVNLHASLLPHYRGANPIATAILNGDSTTGVSLMRMESGLDTGPVYATGSLPILATDTTASLTPRIADLAANLLESHLETLLGGSLPAIAQPDTATLTRPLVKADGRIDWTNSAAAIERQVRAMWPWPRAFTTLPDGDTAVQIHAAVVANLSFDQSDSGKPAGLILPNTSGKPGVLVASGTSSDPGVLVLTTVQLPGGRPLTDHALANNPLLIPGTVLGA
ncbi:MAG: methionyl-tRNA formyltransferase [Thermomicrobiales bacterium]